MANNITEKSLGQALRRYYPRAFALHQDVIFRVNGPGQALPGITRDEKESKRVAKALRNTDLEEKVWDKILSELEIIGFSRADIEEMQELGIDADEDEDEDEKLNVIVPSKIDLRLDSGLNVGRCEKCGHLNWINHMQRNKGGLPVHTNCEKSSRSRYRQAPVFVPYPRDPNDSAKTGSSDQIKIKTILHKQVNCFYFRTGGICNHPSGDNRCDPKPELQKSYLFINPSYPFRGMKIFNNKCPKNLQVPIQGLTTHKGGAIGGGYTYRKSYPNAGLTRRLSCSVAWEGGKHTEEMNRLNSEIEEIKKTWFNRELVNFEETNFSRITVLDLVYGIKIGGYYDHWLHGPGNNNVLGRMLKTQGFVITLTHELWEVAAGLVEKYRPDDTVDPLVDNMMILAHTLKHAILSQVPTFTGVDENLFGGSYEILPDKKGARVYLYDNEVGGHGGFATLMAGNASKFTRMIETVQRQTTCPVRNCKVGCKQCIFIRGCGLGNTKINRRMLLDSGILASQSA